MPVATFFKRNKAIRIILIALVAGSGLVTLAGTIYVRFEYAAVMPRSPQPETGRIFPMAAQYGVVVYVSKQELYFRDFLEYDLGPASAVGGLVVFLLGARFGWFRKRTEFVGNRYLDP
jgi:hypothetical protein